METPTKTVQELRVRLWEAVNAYSEACGGDPSSNVYGNTKRQIAVAEIESVISEASRGSMARVNELMETYLGLRGCGDTHEEAAEAIVSEIDSFQSTSGTSTNIVCPGTSVS